jgi:hypothetical protein
MQRRNFLVSGASILGLLACGLARAQRTPATRIARLQELSEAIDKLGKTTGELGKATDKLGKAVDAATDALTAILYRSRHLVVHVGDGSDAATMQSVDSQLRGPHVLVIWLNSAHEMISLRLWMYYDRAQEADGFSRKRMWTRLLETLRYDLTERAAMLAPIKAYGSDVMPEPAGAKLIETLYARLAFLQALSDRQALSTPAAWWEVHKAERRHNELIYQLFQQLRVAHDEMRSISQRV